jgi:predicted NAD/FAD-dependent oxidoreductase
VHWVAHARTDWSRHHLEQPAAWVQQQLHAALTAYLGQAIEWQYSVVHRWRYALPPERTTATSGGCWWDAAQGLGACGDFLGGPGVEGVEGAWLSAQSLCAELLRTPSVARGAADALTA